MILCIYFWLCGVFVAAQAFLWLQRVGFSLQWLLWLQSTRSRHLGSVAVASWLSSPGSVVVAHGLSCFTACGVLLDQESNLCLLHCHVDSSPPSQQGSPIRVFWATSALFRLSFLLNKYPGVGFLDHRVCVCVCVCVLVAQSCLTLCDPMDCSPPGSSVHGILQARILEWVAISLSRESSWPRDQTCISCIGRQILDHWSARRPHWRKMVITFL